jgi:polysaccharide biosynthesis PFTS motif protein
LASYLLLAKLGIRDWMGGLNHYIKLSLNHSKFAKSPDNQYAVIVNFDAASNQFSHIERLSREPVMDIFGWYMRSKNRMPGIEHYWLHVPHLSTTENDIWNYVKNPLPRIPNNQKWHFLLQGAYLVFRTGIKLLTGKWWAGVILRELLWANYAAHLYPDTVAKEYVHNSMGVIIRPLWSYVVERKGSNILLVHHSLNCLPFSPKTKPKPCLGWGAQISTWPNMIVLSEEIIELFKLQKHIDAQIMIDAEISFVDNGKPLPAKQNVNSVCAFDVTPIKKVLFAELGVIAPYFFGAQAAKQFFTDVITITSKLGWTLNYKAKRAHSSKFDSSYSNVQFNAAKAAHNLTLIDSGISPYRVIENSSVCICLPFTSPAVTGKKLGKPTIYYDPIGTLSSVCPVMHGIEVVSGQKSLELWLSSINKTPISKNAATTDF